MALAGRLRTCPLPDVTKGAKNRGHSEFEVELGCCDREQVGWVHVLSSLVSVPLLKLRK